LIIEKGARVILVPHVFGDDQESDSSGCDSLFNELKEHYGDRLGVVRGSYDQSEIKYVIGQFDFFVGSRMHACIAALSQAVPAVAIAYSDKFIGVMSSIGDPEVVADATKLTADAILERVRVRFDQRTAQRRFLEGVIPEIRHSTLNVLPLPLAQ